MREKLTAQEIPLISNSIVPASYRKILIFKPLRNLLNLKPDPVPGNLYWFAAIVLLVCTVYEQGSVQSRELPGKN
jgi:hypothetical protein